MADLFKIGDLVECDIERLAFEGHGVAKPQNFTLFVPRTAPGDKVTVKITDLKKTYGYGNISEIKTASPHRIEAPCQYYARCGGCHYQHIDPKKVDEEKVQQLKGTFERHGPGAVEILPFLKADSAWNYRNRVTYRRAITGNQGYRAWDNYETLTIDTCMIAAPELNEAWDWVKDKVKHVSLNVLFFVMLRKIGDKIAVVLSVSEDFHPQELQKIFNEHPENYFFYITRIKESSHTAVGKKLEPIFHAPTYLEQQIGDIFYIIRPDLFFQTNDKIAKLLLDKITSSLSVSKEPVIDIYCGSGLFSIALAKLGIPTYGVEVQHDAIQSAKQSAIRNSVEEMVEFHTGPAVTVLQKLVREGASFARAIVDPPRDGLESKVLDAIPELGVKELYYVSCSPPTLARDLKKLVNQGYTIEYCLPLEMFPQTYHIETLTKLVKN
jgi:23S rRNA (uracil1939-C5)-methyltransferase